MSVVESKKTEMKARLPDLSDAVQKIVRDASMKMPEFEHVDASRILILLGEARRASHASVRPLYFSDTASRYSASGKSARPQVRFKGRIIRYVLTLRPLFFLDSTPRDRIATIIHEMFHFSKSFDGTLDPDRRHSIMGKSFNLFLSPLVDRYLDLVPDYLWHKMAINGIVRVRMWLEKPGLVSLRIKPDGKRTAQGRQIYTQKQTFLTTMRMTTSKTDRFR